MKSYRILVDSSKRLSGHPCDFLFDVSRVSSSRDFRQGSYMAAVEWIDPVHYSETSSSYDENPTNPPCLLLECSDINSTNVIGRPKALTMLQSYQGTGKYGVSYDTPYCRTKQLSTVLQGDTLNHSGVLRFTLSKFTGSGYTPCLTNVYSKETVFQLIFWSYPRPENPLAFDFYKLYLNSSDRLSGTTSSCRIPVPPLATSMVAADHWMVAIDGCSLISKTGDAVTGLVVTSDTFGGAYAHEEKIVGFLPKSESYYGQKLSIKHTASDIIGYPCRVTPDTLSSVQITLKDPLLNEVDGVSEWSMCLVIYKHG